MQGLVGDIGGTHARFALAETDGGRPTLRQERTLENTAYSSAEAAIEAYLADAGVASPPERVVLAVAGPVTDGAISFTNSDWRLSEARLRSHGGFRHAQLINDFAAQALGAPHLQAGELRRIGPEVEGLATAPVAVMGPGTGFGVGALVRERGAETAIATEGGHVGFAPADELEVEIWRRVSSRYGRVSIERLLSGPGLYELYLALADIEGAPAGLSDERQVQAAAERGDPLAARTVDRFCRILGGCAGDIALGLGARGGVYLSGGVALKLADAIAAGGFRERFEDKGRFAAYMRAIPTWLALEKYTALLGAARLLPRLEGS